MGIIKDRATTTGQYMTEVNKGSINMSTLTDKLNERHAEGWRLHTMLEQNGNNVLTDPGLGRRVRGDRSVAAVTLSVARHRNGRSAQRAGHGHLRRALQLAIEPGTGSDARTHHGSFD